MNTRDGAFMKNSDLAEKICINLLNKATRVYFGGILGASQSAMAHLLKQRGKLVAGCDQRARSADAEALRAAGIPIDPERQPQLHAGDLVVSSRAHPHCGRSGSHHPRRSAALDRGRTLQNWRTVPHPSRGVRI